MRAIYREVIKAGGFPVVLPAFSGLGADLLKMGTDDQLSYISPVERFMREQADVMIAIMADTNTKAHGFGRSGAAAVLPGRPARTVPDISWTATPRAC